MTTCTSHWYLKQPYGVEPLTCGTWHYLQVDSTQIEENYRMLSWCHRTDRRGEKPPHLVQEYWKRWEEKQECFSFTTSIRTYANSHSPVLALTYTQHLFIQTGSLYAVLYFFFLLNIVPRDPLLHFSTHLIFLNELFNCSLNYLIFMVFLVSCLE